MITLEPIDRALLGGDYGPAAAKAMTILRRYGEISGAERFISIASAHIDGCLYHGPSSIEFARCFVDLGGRVRVPTTLNVGAVDVVHPEFHRGAPDVVEHQRELTALHERLGCLATLTCAPYQRMLRPRAGEHVAWAESNAIVFANSVLGARTDRYGDFADLCAALTGRVPLVGLHCDSARSPTLALHFPPISATGLARELYFAAVGYVVGQRAADRVPLLLGLPLDASEDELKALGAAGASSGALALFHALGLTPEAQSYFDTPIASIEVDAGALIAAIDALCPLAVGDKVAAMCVGTPHYSLTEFAALATSVRGRHAAASVEVYASTSREIAAAVEVDPDMASLRSFGVRLVVDTCTYLAPVVAATRGAIVTTSAKYAHYGPGNLGRRIGLMSLDRCIRSAEAGEVLS